MNKAEAEASMFESQWEDKFIVSTTLFPKPKDKELRFVLQLRVGEEVASRVGGGGTGVNFKTVFHPLAVKIGKQRDPELEFIRKDCLPQETSTRDALVKLFWAQQANQKIYHAMPWIMPNEQDS